MLHLYISCFYRVQLLEIICHACVFMRSRLKYNLNIWIQAQRKYAIYKYITCNMQCNDQIYIINAQVQVMTYNKDHNFFLTK